MKTFLTAVLALSALIPFQASALTAEDICGKYDATKFSALDLGPFGSENATDWQIVDLSDHQITVTAEGNTLTFNNFFTQEDGDLIGVFDPETSKITFQPQTILGNYTICAYPSVGDWYLDNKLQEDPQPFTASIDEDGNIVVRYWAIVSDKDVRATCYYPGTFVPVVEDYSAAEKLCGKYDATKFSALDLGPFGSENATDWQIVDLSDHQITVTAEGNTLTFNNFFTQEDGDLIGVFDPETSKITFQPQTILGSYTICAYPSVGDWYLDNKLQEDPQPFTASIDEDGNIVMRYWAIVSDKDVRATCYYPGTFVPVVEDYSAAEKLCGKYDATKFSALDLGPFGSENATDWQIVDLSDHQITVTAEGNTLTFNNFFTQEDGDLIGVFDPETSKITFQPQTILGNYTICAYPSVGEWYLDNKLQEDPQPFTASIDEDGNIVMRYWAIVSDKDVRATCYYPGTFVPVSDDKVETLESDNAQFFVNVYDIQGRLIRRNVSKEDALQNLPSGLYIVGGKKYVVR